MKLAGGKGTEVVRSICTMCMSRCGVDVHVKDGKVIRVTGMKEHPHNKLCVKAQGITDWLYSPERITSPLRKRDGTWEKISWDEAFDIISDKLSSIRENYGARALVVYLGESLNGSHTLRIADRFCSLYGTPNLTTVGTYCRTARGIGHGLSFSKRMFVPFPSYEGTRCVVVWGTDPEHSGVWEVAEILAAKKAGAKIIVIDPRTIGLAKKADIHIQIKPGTDCALALSLLNVIISEDLYDRAFVQDWTIGFDKLKEHIKKYDPEEVAKITWVPAEVIRKLARIYATSKPAAITQGVSLDHCTNGVQTSRAISTLIAITGNFDIPGGDMIGLPLRQASLRPKGAVSLGEAIGARYPVFSEFVGVSTAIPVVNAVITGEPYPIKALISNSSNPVLTWANANKVREALTKLDLLVVSDMFMTETAKLADIFLPGVTFLEEGRLGDYADGELPRAFLANKAVEPLGDCMENWQIWRELAKKMGYGEYFPWQNSDELFAYLLEPSGITVEQLKQNPTGVSREPNRKQKYLQRGFDTPSGKVEIYSETMEKYGYDPLPTFTEPMEKLVGKTELAESYPFILITGIRVSAYSQSMHRNISRLRKLMPQPLVEINTGTAKGLGIADGEQVIVESPRGSIKLWAKVADDINPKVLSIQHGWNEANANILTDYEELDPISGFPGFKTVMCRVLKAASL